MELLSLDSVTRRFGFVLDRRMYLATLVELPGMIEGQKTLDFRTYYKAVDISQMMYIHPYCIENYDTLTPE